MPLQSVPPPKPVPLAPLTGLDTMLKKPPELVQWIVDDRIATGSVNLLVAKPKVGKTTAARHLAVAVATGAEWLGSACEQGIVWYFAFEGREADHLTFPPI
jgi:RecA-family ATPase